MLAKIRLTTEDVLYVEELEKIKYKAYQGVLREVTDFSDYSINPSFVYRFIGKTTLVVPGQNIVFVEFSQK